MRADAYAPLPRPDLEAIVAQTGDLWREMEGANVFLSGGTGFFGRWLVESLLHANAVLNAGVRATLLTRNPGEFAHRAPHIATRAAITLHQGDVQDFRAPEGRFSHVIHAAFDSGRPVDAPLSAFDTIANGTRRIIEFAASQPLRRMLFVSSGAVYGPQPQGVDRLCEDAGTAPDPLRPASAYAEGKRVGEMLCGIAADNGLPVSIARCFAFIGPGMPLNAHFAAGNFLRDAARGGDILVQGDGSPRRTYLYAGDLAVWLWTILLRGMPGRAYNVGGNKPVSIAELATAVARGGSSGARVRVLGAPVGGTAQRYIPDVSRAARELGLRPRVSLDEAVARTFRWLAA